VDLARLSEEQLREEAKRRKLDPRPSDGKRELLAKLTPPTRRKRKPRTGQRCLREFENAFERGHLADFWLAVETKLAAALEQAAHEGAMPHIIRLNCGEGKGAVDPGGVSKGAGGSSTARGGEGGGCRDH